MATNTNPAPPPPKKNFAGLIVFLLIAGGFFAFFILKNRDPTDLWVVNGLTIPVSVTVDGQTLELEAESWQMIEPGGGEYEVVVTSEGREISRETITIDGDHVMGLYNILGAAYVFGDTIWYTAYGGSGGERNWELYAFDTYTGIDEEKVHLRFEPAPNSASISSGSSRAYYRWVGVNESGQWNWRRTLSEAASRRSAEFAEGFEARLREAMPNERFAGAPPTNAGSPAGRGAAPAGTPQSGQRGQAPPGTGGKSRR